MQQKILRLADYYLFEAIVAKVGPKPSFPEGASKIFWFSATDNMDCIEAVLVKKKIDKEAMALDYQERLAGGTKPSVAKKEAKLLALDQADLEEKRAEIWRVGEYVDVHGLFKEVADEMAIENGDVSDLRPLWMLLGKPCLSVSVESDMGWARIFKNDAYTMAEQSVVEEGRVVKFKCEATYSLFIDRLVLSLPEDADFEKLWAEANAVLGLASMADVEVTLGT